MRQGEGQRDRRHVRERETSGHARLESETFKNLTVNHVIKANISQGLALSIKGQPC